MHECKRLYAHAEIFIDELTQKMGSTPVGSDGSLLSPPRGPPPSSSSGSASAKLAETVQQQHDPLFQAAKIGYETDAYLTPKDGVGVWQIRAIVDEGNVELTEIVEGADAVGLQRVMFSPWCAHFPLGYGAHLGTPGFSPCGIFICPVG